MTSTPPIPAQATARSVAFKPTSGTSRTIRGNAAYAIGLAQRQIRHQKLNGETRMKPFDLIAALNGAPVCNAYGPVTQLHRFTGSTTDHCVFGVTSGGQILNWTEDGIFGIGLEQAVQYASMNLMMVADDE